MLPNRVIDATRVLYVDEVPYTINHTWGYSMPFTDKLPNKGIQILNLIGTVLYETIYEYYGTVCVEPPYEDNDYLRNIIIQAHIKESDIF
jgi:hypothetical protein